MSKFASGCAMALVALTGAFSMGVLGLFAGTLLFVGVTHPHSDEMSQGISRSLGLTLCGVPLGLLGFILGGLLGIRFAHNSGEQPRGRSMAGRGVHFALTTDDERRLLSLVGDDVLLLATLQEDIEEQWDEDWLQETDKAWDAIHRCLTDGTLSFTAASPLHKCILGGQQLYSGKDYIVFYLNPDEVHGVADAIASIDEATMREKYFNIKEEDYGSPVTEEDWHLIWSRFVPLTTFFVQAAAANRAVIFTVSQ